ncbi:MULTISPECIES: DUF5658 family protein [Bacillaceae]|uniref:DUF5658 family protein n=1 Tax=Bacillaceae TaxID=186817 RepID=UPI002FFD9561
MRLCIFLLIAGTLDALLTQLGIVSGVIEEGNPMMRMVMEHGWYYFYFIKIILPLVLLGLYYLRPLQGKIRMLLVSTCVLYFSVIVLHIVWIIFYLNPSI